MLVLDIETTGLDSRKHSIVSVGAVDFGEPGNQFYRECRIWEGAEIVREALEVNGFTEEQVRDPKKDSVEDVLVSFGKWLGGIGERTLAGENVWFDRLFLVDAATRYGIELGLGYRTVDLHTLCYAGYLRNSQRPPSRNGRSDLNTDRILEYVGLPAEPRPHNALMGAKLEAEAFSRLIRCEGLLDEFKGHPVPENLVAKWTVGSEPLRSERTLLKP